MSTIDKNAIKAKLESIDPSDIIDAINWIDINNDSRYVDYLEYLLNHENPEVMERAFEVVMKFKGTE